MSAMRAVVLTASIENEESIREWMAAVHEAAGVVQSALDDLSRQLQEAPHISIHLNQSDPKAPK